MEPAGQTGKNLDIKYRLWKKEHILHNCHLSVLVLEREDRIREHVLRTLEYAASVSITQLSIFILYFKNQQKE